MREIRFVTGNKGKVEDASKILYEYGIKVVQQTLPIPEPRSWHVKEIAIQKANFVKKHLNKPFMVEDGGFFIPSIGGFPATQVNFVLQTIGLKGLLKLLEEKERYCEFRNALAYWDFELKEPVIFEHKDKGTVSNNILSKDIEHNWSSLAQIFIPEGFNKPLADSEVNEKFHENWYKTSHIRKLGEWLRKRSKK